MRTQINNVSHDEQIEYIRDLTRELIILSKPCARPFLTYLLEMVYHEILNETVPSPEKSMVH